MRKYHYRLIVVPLCFFILLGCSAQSTKVTTPTLEQPTLEVPTPGPNSGVVTGKLIDSITGKPYKSDVFLSKNLTSDHPEMPPLISFSYDSNPRAAQDDAGNFIFKDVPPGEYVIALWSPGNVQFVLEKGTSNPFQIKVEAGKVLELGEIRYP